MANDKRVNPALWGVGTPIEYAWVHHAVLPILNSNRNSQTSELRYGDLVKIYSVENEWALVAGQDNYLGWAKRGALTEGEPIHTDRVSVRSTHIYPEPSIKSVALWPLTLGSCLSVKKNHGEFVQIDEGYIFAPHVEARDWDAAQWAIQLLGAPYLWGGGSSEGIDCSGLMQLAYSMIGIGLSRDSDQQEAELKPMDAQNIKRGDLVFWKGHVAMMISHDEIIHATAWKMQVICEPLAQTIARIGNPTSYRRVDIANP